MAHKVVVAGTCSCRKSRVVGRIHEARAAVRTNLHSLLRNEKQEVAPRPPQGIPIVTTIPDDHTLNVPCIPENPQLYVGGIFGWKCLHCSHERDVWPHINFHGVEVN